MELEWELEKRYPKLIYFISWGFSIKCSRTVSENYLAILEIG